MSPSSKYPPTPLGVRLKADRAASGVSQRTVAVTIGCYEKQISQWENGVVKPNPEWLEKLAGYYGQPFSDYFALWKQSPSSGVSAARAREYRARVAESDGGAEVAAAIDETLRPATPPQPADPPQRRATDRPPG